MFIDLKDFTRIFEKITYCRTPEQVFTDFLDISICALANGKYEDEYISIVRRYKKDEVNLFCELFAQTIMIMDNDGLGLRDCLGEFFQNNITKGRHGQFFTPEHICDFMAAVTISPDESERTIFDPACGSGRMLLSAAKVNRNNYFFGADIDHTCCKMTAINLCLNSMIGEVAWMDSLAGTHWGGYSIERIGGLIRVPVITKLNANEGVIIKSEPFSKTIGQTKLDLK